MTTRTLKVAQLALAAAAGMACLLINDNLSSSQQSSLIAQADARVGRPLTPGSVAGVARRTDRRAVRRGAIIGGAAVGTGAYYGYGAYGNGYGAYGAYGSNAGGDNAAAYCMQRFKSYDPASGTYLGFDGNRHACP